MNISKPAMVLLVALGAMLLLQAVPPVSAQGGTSLSITPPADMDGIKPDSGSGTGTFKVRYTQTGGVYQSPTGAVSSSLVVKLSANCDNTNAIPTVPPTVTINIATAAQKSFYDSDPITVSVTISKDAPGLKKILCHINAHADAVIVQNAAGPADAQPADFKVSSAFFPLIQAKVANKVDEAGPQKTIPFNIELTNFGNAQTKIRFQLATTDYGKWNPVLPDTLTLDSPSSGGGTTKDTASFQVATPFHNGWNNEEKSFQITMTPIATQDETQTGTPIDATVLARVRGIYVPGFESVAMLGALLGAVFVARTRNDE